MKPPITDCAESRVHLTRLPGLADPVLQFDLPKEIEQLRTKESWGREAGRQQRFASIRLCGRFRRALNGSLWRKAIAGRIILRP
jgi:hypothetical protein